ncbi:MAG: TIR domain-containing protein [Hyphomicrobiales bacterium]|nr:TIR domain-containing protein [Hyphomicrobiales bacterium]
MADIFISYKSEERALPQALAEFLRAQGYTVWWDMELVGGPSFRRQILDKLAEARAVIVIWTPASVESDFVLDEADRAKRMGKLIPVRTPDLDPHNIPPGHGQAQTYFVTDHSRVLTALAAMSVNPTKKKNENYNFDGIVDEARKAVASAELVIKQAKKFESELGRGTRVTAAFAFTALVFMGVYLMIPPKPITPAPDASRPGAAAAAKAETETEPATKIQTEAPVQDVAIRSVAPSDVITTEANSTRKIQARLPFADNELGDNEKRSILLFEGHSLLVSSVGFSPDSKTILSASWDKTVRLWNAQTGGLIRTLKGHKSAIYDAGFSLDGKSIVSGSFDSTARLWSAQTGSLIHTLEGHGKCVSAVAFSPDGKTVVSGSYDQTLKLWNTETGSVIRTLEGHGDTVWAASFSPDGKTIISGSWDKTLKLWEVKTGRLIRTFEGHMSKVNAVAFSPDGKNIVSGSEDKTLKLWDTGTGKLIRTLEGHGSTIWATAFSPDGKTIVSGSWDKTIKLWNANTGQLIQTLNAHGNIVASVSFSPNGSTIVSAGCDEYDGTKFTCTSATVKLWDVSEWTTPQTAAN